MRREFCACSNSCRLIAPASTSDSSRLTCCRQVLDVRFGARAAGLRAANRRLLLVGVDLDERASHADAVAGLDEDARDDAFHFGLDRRRAERAQRGDELRRLLDRFLLQRQQRHCRRGAAAAAAAPTGGRSRLPAAVTCGDGEQGNQSCGDNYRSSVRHIEVFDVRREAFSLRPAIRKGKGHACAWPRALVVQPFRAANS